MPIFIATQYRRPLLASALLPALMLWACATAATPKTPTPAPPAPAPPTTPAPAPTPPTSPATPTTTPATPANPATAAILPTIPDDAKPILERLFKQYAPLQGLSVIARHRIQGQSRVLHESVRTLSFAKPNRFRVDVDGTTLVTNNGTQCWQFNRDMLGYNQVPTPQSMSAAIANIRTLGGGSIAGSGGIVAALLSADPRTALLSNVDDVSVVSAGKDDVLVLHIRANRGTVRKGTKIGLFIPKIGPAWIAQADIIPQDVMIHTRIAFEQWTPSELPTASFELDPGALKLNTLDPPATGPPVTDPAESGDTKHNTP